MYRIICSTGFFVHVWDNLDEYGINMGSTVFDTWSICATQKNSSSFAGRLVIVHLYINHPRLGMVELPL